MKNNERTAAILSIGNELLFGETINTNASFMARLLTREGFRVARILAIPDIKEVIGECVIKAGEDVVLLSGGLGPTSDDLTAESLAGAFGVKMLYSEKEAARIKNFFQERNRPMPESVLRQALYPEGFRALPNPAGTAPYLFKPGKPVIFAMPGVPREMRAIMEQEVIPSLKKMFQTKPLFHHEIQTAGIGESSISEMIKDIPVPTGIQLAYLPEIGKVLVRLTGTDSTQLNNLGKQFKSRLKSCLVSDKKEKLEEVIQKYLTRKKLRLATAESLTGGLIGAALTAIPGSSEYFDSALVTYSNASKTSVLGVTTATLRKHGAVSEAVVREMAHGLQKKRNVHAAIAVSGIAGPGGSSQAKPVGTVWIATALKKEIVCRLHHFRGERDLIRERTVQEALVQMWNMIR